MARSVQIGSSIARSGHSIRRTLRNKRIEDVVGLQILAGGNWKETRAELRKIGNNTLNRLEKPYQ